MVSNKVTAVLLVLLILVLTAVMGFVANALNVVDLSDMFPFLEPKREVVTDQHEPPDALAREELRKEWEKIEDARDELVDVELGLKEKAEELDRREDEIDQLKESLEIERKKFSNKLAEWDEREKKVKDLAGKVANMPPQDSVAMLLTWPDYDIISVLRQMDKDAAEAGNQTLTPFLITLIEKAEKGRGGMIMQKMLENPKLSALDQG